MTFNLAAFTALATTTAQPTSAAYPLTDFRKRIDDGILRVFLKSEYAQGMTTLDLSDSAVTATALQDLVSSPHAKGLYTLRLARTQAAGATPVTAPELEKLDVHGSKLTPGLLRLIAAKLPALREIVTDNPIQVIETILNADATAAESGKVASPIRTVNGIDLGSILSGPLRRPGRGGGGRE